MDSLFNMYTAGYTHAFVKRQRYFPLASLQTACIESPITPCYSADENKLRCSRETLAALYRDTFRYLVHDVYLNDTDRQLFVYRSIIDTKTNREILHMTEIPIPALSLVLVSMSEKHVHLLEDLTSTSYFAIRDTQTMVKRLWIDPVMEPATVADIISRDLLKQWLPDGATFDLDRYPAENKIISCECGWECHEDSSASKWRQLLRYGKPKYRWIRYANRDAGKGYDSRSACIPLHVVPEDRSLLMIPMKRKNDKHIRDCRDDFEMFVEIIHCRREKGKVGDAIHDIMQHIDNL